MSNDITFVENLEAMAAARHDAVSKANRELRGEVDKSKAESLDKLAAKIVENILNTLVERAQEGKTGEGLYAPIHAFERKTINEKRNVVIVGDHIVLDAWPDKKDPSPEEIGRREITGNDSLQSDLKDLVNERMPRGLEYVPDMMKQSEWVNIGRITREAPTPDLPMKANKYH